MRFEINFDDVEPMEEDEVVAAKPTPAKPLAQLASPLKAEAPSKPLPVAEPPTTPTKKPAAPRKEEVPAVSREPSASSTSSSWHKAETEAEPEEEPWEEIDYEKEVNGSKQTPSKSVRQENKENLHPVTPKKDEFLTPTVLKHRDFPSEPNNSTSVNLPTSPVQK